MSSKNYDLYKNPNQNPPCDEFSGVLCAFLWITFWQKIRENALVPIVLVNNTIFAKKVVKKGFFPSDYWLLSILTILTKLNAICCGWPISQE